MKKLLVLIIAMGLMACESWYIIEYDTQYGNPQTFAVLKTEGVTIKAVEYDWQLNYSDPVMPPKYHNSSITFKLTRDYKRSIQGYRILKKEVESSSQPYARYMSTDYSKYANGGEFEKDAFDVKVYVEGLDKPLYGKMFFASARKDLTESSAKRAWTVQVPSKYINIAQSGDVAVVYQPASTENTIDVVVWALWLSKYPL